MERSSKCPTGAFQGRRAQRGLVLVTQIISSISSFNKNLEVLFFKIALTAKGISEEEGGEGGTEGEREGKRGTDSADDL